MAHTPLVLFDGDCGFCAACLRWAQRWVRPRVVFLAWQDADLAALGVTTAECAAAVQWISVRTEGESWRLQRASGGQAVCRTLRAGVAPWPVLGAVGMAPGVRSVVDWCYRLVARHRHRLPGGNPRCTARSMSEAKPSQAQPSQAQPSRAPTTKSAR